MGRLGTDDLEDLSAARLAAADQEELLTTQTECTFVFAGADGWPTGVVMSFLWDGTAFWLTAVSSRRHVKALARDDRVTLVISGIGTDLAGRRMLSIRGRASVHTDPETKAWFFEHFAQRLNPDARPDFIRLLDSPHRVVVRVDPVQLFASHDSRRIAGDGRGGEPRGQTT